jgi:hypothetical protein
MVTRSPDGTNRGSPRFTTLLLPQCTYSAMVKSVLLAVAGSGRAGLRTAALEPVAWVGLRSDGSSMVEPGATRSEGSSREGLWSEGSSWEGDVGKPALGGEGRRTHISFTLWDWFTHHANATDCSLLSIICCLSTWYSSPMHSCSPSPAVVVASTAAAESYVYLVHNISLCYLIECPNLFHMPMYNADKIF